MTKGGNLPCQCTPTLTFSHEFVWRLSLVLHLARLWTSSRCAPFCISTKQGHQSIGLSGLVLMQNGAHPWLLGALHFFSASLWCSLPRIHPCPCKPFRVPLLGTLPKDTAIQDKGGVRNNHPPLKEIRKRIRRPLTSDNPTPTIYSLYLTKVTHWLWGLQSNLSPN